MPDPTPPPHPLRPAGCLAAGAFAALVILGLAVALAWPHLPHPAPAPAPAPPAVNVVIPQPMRVVVEAAQPSAGPPQPAPGTADDGDPQVRAAAFAYFNFFVKNYYDVAAAVAAGKDLSAELGVTSAVHDQQKRSLADVINRRHAEGASLGAIAKAVFAARRGVP